MREGCTALGMELLRGESRPPGGDLEVGGDPEKERSQVTHTAVSQCDLGLWVTDGLSDQFIRTNGLLCYSPTEHAGCRFKRGLSGDTGF